MLGDKTDHGGTVIEGDTTSVVGGKPIARLGDKVSCPKCKGVYPIVEGVADTLYSDKPVAIHGHRTSCGAILIGSQTLLTVSVEVSGLQSAQEQVKELTLSANATVSKAGPQGKTLGGQEGGYDRQFQLFDELTGAPLAKQRYRLIGPLGAHEGVTDGDGFTASIHTGGQMADVQLEIIGEGWPERTS